MRRALTVIAVWIVVGACGGGHAPSRSQGTVRGRVLSAPTCPVERIGSPCPPGPVVGAPVVATRDGHRTESTTTRAGGEFTLWLPAGRYVVTATNVGGYPSTAASIVDVKAHVVTWLTLTVDTGIR